MALLVSAVGIAGAAMLDAPTVSADDAAIPIVAPRFVALPAVARPFVALPVVATPSDDVPPAPPGTVSEFFPESANLSDCVGLVEKPGCGSEARGGWRQTLVFLALFAGLGVILWRVSRGIASNRRTIDAGIDAGAGSDTDSDVGSDTA